MLGDFHWLHVSSFFCVARVDEIAEPEKAEKVFEVNTDIFQPPDKHNFDKEVLRSEKPALILFGAERCTHCKALHPVLEETVTEEFKDEIEVFYVDADQNLDLTEKYDIIGIPVTAIFKDEKEVDRIQGEQDYDDLADFIENAIK